MQKTERAMCEVKIMDRKNTDELMNMLGLDETMNKMAKAKRVRLYYNVLRRKDDDVLWKALKFKLDVKNKRERPWVT